MKNIQITALAAYAALVAAAPAPMPVAEAEPLSIGDLQSLFPWLFPAQQPAASAAAPSVAAPAPSNVVVSAPSVIAKAPVAASSAAAVVVPVASVAPSAAASAAPSAAASAPAQGNCTPQGMGGGTTENGIHTTYCCTDVTVLFARGTTEAGNVGYSTGPSFFQSLRTKLGADRVTVQGTEYPATWDGNLSGGGTGGASMAQDAQTILGRCPNTKIVVSGYSQGGMVAHNAFKNGLNSPQVQAAVIFGDPYNGQAVGNLPASKTKEFCASGDDVCDGSGSFAITAAHGTYPQNADEAASFVITALGL